MKNDPCKAVPSLCTAAKIRSFVGTSWNVSLGQDVLSGLLAALTFPHFHSTVEYTVEKNENAIFAFDKQKGFNALHPRPTRPMNFEIALKTGIDNNEATV